MDPIRVTSTGSAVVGEGTFGAAILIAGSGAGYGPAYLRLYDNETEPSGTTLCELATVENDSKPSAVMRVPYKEGIYDVITGTGASAIIYRD